MPDWQQLLQPANAKCLSCGAQGTCRISRRRLKGFLHTLKQETTIGVIMSVQFSQNVTNSMRNACTMFWSDGTQGTCRISRRRLKSPALRARSQSRLPAGPGYCSSSSCTRSRLMCCMRGAPSPGRGRTAVWMALPKEAPADLASLASGNLPEMRSSQDGGSAFICSLSDLDAGGEKVGERGKGEARSSCRCGKLQQPLSCVVWGFMLLYGLSWHGM